MVQGFGLIKKGHIVQRICFAKVETGILMCGIFGKARNLKSFGLAQDSCATGTSVERTRYMSLRLDYAATAIALESGHCFCHRCATLSAINSSATRVAQHCERASCSRRKWRREKKKKEDLELRMRQQFTLSGSRRYRMPRLPEKASISRSSLLFSF